MTAPGFDPVLDSTDPDQSDMFGGTPAPAKGHYPKEGTQNAKVLAWLESGRTISDAEAYTQLRIRRLAARIYDLRHAYGWSIHEEREEHDGGTHSVYSL